jgi:hypothetical protein
MSRRRLRGVGCSVGCLLVVWLGATPARAQQRPLSTEDPEPIGAGRVLLEAGVEFANGQEYPASGLTGDLWKVPTVGLSIGISSIAEFQLDGAPFTTLDINRVDPGAPLAPLLSVDGNRTSDVEDLVVATKIRVLAEAARRPAIAFRFATKLPNAQNESGLGLDTTDFFASLLTAKTVQSVRLVGNIGFGILADPTVGTRQNDVLTYGVSFARALTDQGEVVGELNGRVSTRSGDPFPGTESRGRLLLGGRYTWTSVRLDAGVFFGLTAVDPSAGFSGGFTYVFRAFDIP